MAIPLMKWFEPSLILGISAGFRPARLQFHHEVSCCSPPFPEARARPLGARCPPLGALRLPRCSGDA
eukprot:9110170-Alexandrium_andersonii.AAC.1